MKALRAEDITLFCEDGPRGRTQRLLNAVVLALRTELPHAAIVSAVGVLGKNDVLVRTKFARMQTSPPLRVVGVRDRDFLPTALVDQHRRNAFATKVDQTKAWPLSRHCIESYLLDDDVLDRATLGIALAELRQRIDELAARRLWLDVARGTLEDLAFRARSVRPPTVREPPRDRDHALELTLEAAHDMNSQLVDACADTKIEEQLTDLSEDMKGANVRWRVDGRELVRDLARHPALKGKELLSILDEKAVEAPPAALIADIRQVLQAMPQEWTSADD